MSSFSTTRFPKSEARRNTILLIALVSLAGLAGCAAGDPKFTPSDPAGFWLGLWHGFISVFALVIGIFSDTVRVYETNNTGGWYDFGFVMGILTIWGGGSKANPARRRRVQRERDERQRDCDELSTKVEAKLKRKIREWSDAEPDEDWNVVEAKAEAKLRKKVREWAEEE